MEETESQIAKIVLGNNKSSSSYVYVMAEKAGQTEDEIYMVAELPILNPAAKDACERICLAIASTLKRAYKTQANENNFENALSSVNEELGKLAALGQTEWVNKLNCILATKSGQNFHIATCGKTAAYLLRSREYTDITCSQDKSHPLKTFENFASGKIRLNDVLILSTVQLFNYVSMDRLLSVVNTADFLTASRTIIELLKQTAETTVSFGIILNLQTLPGVNLEEDIDLENYSSRTPNPVFSLPGKILGYLKQAFALTSRRKAQTALPNIPFSQKLKAFGGSTLGHGRAVWKKAKSGAQSARAAVDLQNFRQMAPAKRLLLVSIAILLIASIFSVYVAVHLKGKSSRNEQITNELKETQSLLSNSQSSLLYQDDQKAADFFRQAQAKLPPEESINDDNKDFYKQVLEEFNKTKSQMEKVVEVETTNLGSLGQAENLIKLPAHLAIQANQTVISYNRESEKIEDSALKGLSVNALATAAASENSVVVYDGSALRVWNTGSGELGQNFTTNVPQKEDFAGLAWYSSTSRVYTVDKKNQSITSFVVASGSLSKPTVSAKNPVLSSSVDLAIDGNIYVLGKDGVSKFTKGVLADFSIATLAVPFSGSGKIYTQKDFVNLYVLDSGNNRVLVFGKNGSLISTLKSSSFTGLKDLEVDEKKRVMYLLNDGSLLKVSLP